MDDAEAIETATKVLAEVGGATELAAAARLRELAAWLDAR